MASIDLLVSVPGAEPGVDSVPPSYKAEAPTFTAFRAAADRWMKRAGSHPDNIAIFYFAGRGYERGNDTLLFMDDFPGGRGHTQPVGVEFLNLAITMERCPARRQAFFLDIVEEEMPVQLFGESLFAEMPSRSDPPARAILRATAKGGRAFARPQEGGFPPASTFAETLVATLTASRVALSVQRLARALEERLRAFDPDSGPRFGAVFTTDFDFCDLSQPDSAPVVPESPSPRPETPIEGAAEAIPSEEAAETPLDDAEEAAQSEEATEAPLDETTNAAPPEEAEESAPIEETAEAQTPQTQAAAAPPSPADDNADSDFIPDDAEEERDELGRAGLAIALGRHLHKVWCRANDPAPARADTAGAFVVHLDAPWGGGKTTFANFLARVLSPRPGRAAQFLRDRFPGADVGGIFLEDPSRKVESIARLAAMSSARRRPWIVVPFNAWQAEHCTPPWWVFYQSIRKGCFDTIWREGDLPWAPEPAGLPKWRRRLRRWWSAGWGWLRGKDRWLVLIAREYLWRLFNPKIVKLLATAAISLLALSVLIWLDVLGPGRTATGAATGASFIVTNGLGLVLAGLTGVTAIWGFGALVTESIVPGTDNLAERLNLGNGDPFARFRAHFADTMESVARPVMVIVDDLDRCRPDFVVDLVRGIQTLLRSPRVVFVILGDRDWIERAFEAHHEKMSKIDVGPEQTFGARFVEKAIQMSFVLPRLAPTTQLSYLRRVLLGEGNGAGGAGRLTTEAAAGLNEALTRVVDEDRTDPVVTDEQFQKALDEIDRLKTNPGDEPILTEPEVKRLLNERLASNVPLDRKIEESVIHELEVLTPYFPANPRQMKRIVNAITLYFAVAVALSGTIAERWPGFVPDKAFRNQLALWVIVMTEWPRTWRLLASFPLLVDLLAGRKPDPAAKPPGSPDAIARALDRIRADPQLTALITGLNEKGEKSHESLTTSSATLLSELAPLHAPRLRLPETVVMQEPPAAAPPAAQA